MFIINLAIATLGIAINIWTLYGLYLLGQKLGDIAVHILKGPKK